MPESSQVSPNSPVSSNAESLATRLMTEIDAIISSCEEHKRPLETDPARSELFSLFVLAYEAGLTAEESSPDLSADGICQTLATNWGLKDAAQQSVRTAGGIPAEQMAKMRSLWSVMRMWMEWTYAWDHWSEFHPN